MSNTLFNIFSPENKFPTPMPSKTPIFDNLEIVLKIVSVWLRLSPMLFKISHSFLLF